MLLSVTTISDDVVDLKAIAAALEERLVYEIYALKLMVQSLTGHSSNYNEHYAVPPYNHINYQPQNFNMRYSAYQNSPEQRKPNEIYSNYPTYHQNQFAESSTQPIMRQTTATVKSTEAFVPPTLESKQTAQPLQTSPATRTESAPNVKQLLKSMESKFMKNRNSLKASENETTTTPVTTTNLASEVRPTKSNSYTFHWKLENFTHNLRAPHINEIFSHTIKVIILLILYLNQLGKFIGWTCSYFLLVSKNVEIKFKKLYKYGQGYLVFPLI